VCLYGSRQVGKTTLARAIAASSNPVGVCLDLELPSDRRKLDDPEIFLRDQRDRLVVLDEVQRVPELFSVLRPLIDADRRPGRFLVLGSAGPELLRQASESLAGRIVYIELPPFWIGEVDATDAAADRLWLRGGYPSSFLARSDADSLAWREAFLHSYVERDLPQLGVRVPSTTMERFLRMLAHLHGQTWNASVVARSLGVSSPTAARYLDVLVAARLVRRLEPFHANLKKRLVKSPKIYLRDPGLLHALLGIARREDLLGHVAVGASFEGFAIEQVLASLHDRFQRDAAFYRTHGGAEIDLVLTLPRGARTRRVGIEVKHSVAPTVSRGTHEAMTDLDLDEIFVAVPRGKPFQLAEKIHVVTVRDLAAENWLP
jgi:predicted AAA+ superfamily ATPase